MIFSTSRYFRPFLSSFPGSNLGRVTKVFTRETPSRADHSVPISDCSSSFESSSSSLPSCKISLHVRTVPERFRPFEPERTSFSTAVLTCSASKLCCSSGLVLEADDRLLEFESRKRQTTAQSSILEVGYLYFHALTAVSTRVRAAVVRFGADAIISTTSLFDSTSHICKMKHMPNFIHEKEQEDLLLKQMVEEFALILHL